jgi:hypothetical protein
MKTNSRKEVLFIICFAVLMALGVFFMHNHRPSPISSPPQPSQQSDLYLLIEQQNLLGNQVAIIGPDKLVIKVLRNQ